MTSQARPSSWFGAFTNPTLLTAIQNALILFVVALLAWLTSEPLVLLAAALIKVLPTPSIDHYAIGAGIAQRLDDAEEYADVGSTDDVGEDGPAIGFTAKLRTET